MEKSGNQASALQKISEDLRRSQKLSKPPVSSACVAIWEARRLFGSLLLEVYFQSSVFTLPCLIQGRYDCYGWTNEQCDTVGKMMIESMTFWDESVDDALVTRNWSWGAGCVHWWAAAQVRSVSGRTFMQWSARNHADQKSQGRKVTKGAWHWKAYLNCAKQSSSDRNVQSFMATTKSILFRNLCSFIFFLLLILLSLYVLICPYISLCLAVFHFAICCWGSDLVVRVCFSFSNCAGCLASNGFVEWMSAPEGPTQYEKRNK